MNIGMSLCKYSRNHLYMLSGNDTCMNRCNSGDILRHIAYSNYYQHIL
ncbi:MAG: hypothetical protein IJ533_05740 [Prevotella sp.]|nr:hypothetical protein [Prevotella sp.]